MTTLKKGDYFIFSGLNLVCLQISSETILVKKIKKKINKTPIYWGGNLSLSENLSNEILKKFPKATTGSYKRFENEMDNIGNKFFCFMQFLGKFCCFQAFSFQIALMPEP